MNTRRRFLLAAPLTLAALPARAQPAWPERPVRFIVPFPAGSTPDLTGRAVAARLAAAFGHPFVVENRAGAGGTIGTDLIAKANDGHVLGLSINGPLSTAPALYPNLPYDPARDLRAVSLLVRGAQALVVHPDFPARDLAGFAAHARANPGAIAFGSVGAGSGGHLAMLDLAARLGGLELLHVPYRGFPEATLDLVAGRIQAMVVTAAAVLPQLREGRARALATTGTRRFPGLPEVPTLAELGIADADSYGWQVMVVPAATPAARIARLAEEAQAALADPGTRQRLEAAGFEVVGSGPEEAAHFVAAEAARWGGLIRRLGIRAEG
ncbi:Bug family tripartite tricarboxylate transporter substrate binding protein [Plastoroseomonas hellenica]|uniref:Bug family tripartite tricarboxylate transporter substrate binding protein n=1 Tax=Plastoroseomonas hellenica TaxID=2687306 RepID=UPI001BA48A2C|nr:tripartite tricarboxylate transporter substrate binding protein [Plastoroseomonas hellenica]MBR0646581.1 tripartite tricarboxylate transporter substrate binding protein [Plastoroseomonas hellenica]